jgi:hypothetical protein
MAKQKGKQQERKPLTGLEILGLRVSAMINSPRSQLERTVHIHRLDTETDEDWAALLELLGETDDLTIAHDDDGGITLFWGMPTDYNDAADKSDASPMEEEAPF